MEITEDESEQSGETSERKTTELSVLEWADFQDGDERKGMEGEGYGRTNACCGFRILWTVWAF